MKSFLYDLIQCFGPFFMHVSTMNLCAVKFTYISIAHKNARITIEDFSHLARLAEGLLGRVIGSVRRNLRVFLCNGLELTRSSVLGCSSEQSNPKTLLSTNFNPLQGATHTLPRTRPISSSQQGCSKKSLSNIHTHGSQFFKTDCTNASFL